MYVLVHVHVYTSIGSVYYVYRTAGHIGGEQSLANWRICLLGVTVLNTWMQD